VAYLAFSVPALIAGVATTRSGLHSTVLVYCAALVAVAAVAVALLVLRSDSEPAARSTVMPAGPCTAPPCPGALAPRAAV
jgi:hypothetical protein